MLAHVHIGLCVHHVECRFCLAVRVKCCKTCKVCSSVHVPKVCTPNFVGVYMSVLFSLVPLTISKTYIYNRTQLYDILVSQQCLGCMLVCVGHTHQHSPLGKSAKTVLNYTPTIASPNVSIALVVIRNNLVQVHIGCRIPAFCYLIG